MDCLILISIITFCLELVSKGKFMLGPFMRRIFVNPLIISIFLSVFLKFFNFNLGDGPINYFLTKLADCTMPVGLLALGIILSQVSGNIFSKLTVIGHCTEQKNCCPSMNGKYFPKICGIRKFRSFWGEIESQV